MPEKLRRPRVSFAEIALDTLSHSKAHKVHEAYRIDRWHMETLLTWFREHVAEEISPREIERKLSELAEDGRKPATVNRLPNADESCVFAGRAQWQALS